MRILFFKLSWSRGSRENELEVILHESTRESRTNRRAMHNVSNSIKQIVDRDGARQRSSDAFIASFIPPRE
jgi:hypothetical protein